MHLDEQAKRENRTIKRRTKTQSYPQRTCASSVVPLELGDHSFGSWICIATPYPFTFTAHAKKRWLGRTVLDIYENEFGAYPKSYFETAIEQGRILVSEKRVQARYQVKDGDILSHSIHRHEPSVAVSSQDGIEVIAETPDLVIVDKPGTLPVHPCGAYSQNCLLGLLEPKFGKLYNVNRLDRLTSGLVMVAKTPKVAKEMAATIRLRESCQKMYLARVKGKFPLNCKKELVISDKDGALPQSGEWLNDTSESIQSNKMISAEQMVGRNALGYWITDEGGNIQRHATLDQVFASKRSIRDWLGTIDSSAVIDEKQTYRTLWFCLSCPVRIADPKDGICEAGSFCDLDDKIYQNTVKPAQTGFTVVRYDETTDSTILLCRPMTGRSHQIRLHLQFVGHPIANDSDYGGDLWYANKDGQVACQEAQAQLLAWDEGSPTSDTRATCAEVATMAACRQQEGESTADFIKNTCFLCTRQGGAQRSILEFLVKSQGIWLHAFQYTLVDFAGETICHRTKVPRWC